MAYDVLWMNVLLLCLTVVLSGFSNVQAQLNFYIAKHDANSCLKLNYNMDLYLIKDNEPALLLKDATAFRDFMSPLSSKIDVVKLRWFSSPKTSRYHIKMNSSDTDAMPHPIPSIPAQGIISHSPTEFDVSFGCTGKKEGMVLVSLELNYTSVVSTAISPNTQRTFTLEIRRWCEKTIPDPTPQPNVGGIHWSRAAIVGLCAGITLVACLSIGIGLLIKYLLRQRKLKMNFEDDLDLTEKKEFKKRKVRSLPLPSLSSAKSSHPVIYSPKHDSLSVAGTRPRSNTNRSDTSTAGLIGRDDSEDEDHNAMQQVCECETREQQVAVSILPTKKPIPESTPQRTEILSQMILSWKSQLAGYLISKEQLHIQELLTEGTVYKTYRGVLVMDSAANQTQQVSVRILKERYLRDIEMVAWFIQGAISMLHLSHPNVLPLVGVILQPSAPPCIIQLYEKHQRLPNVLLQSRGTSSTPQAFTSSKLLDIAIQISRGMEYLTNRKRINLLSSHCMVNAEGKIRIDPQSLDHNMPNNDEARQAVPESLEETTCNEKMNVWFFGAILWEIITLGQELPKGPTLPKPINCPEELYDVLIKCRHMNPGERPSFSWLSSWLSEYQTRLMPGTLTFETSPGRSLPIC